MLRYAARFGAALNPETLKKDPMPLDTPSTRFGSGKSVRRVEDENLLKGAGLFADDVDAPGQTRLAILRSPYAHARIDSIDTTAAKAMPGVVAVLTGDDLSNAGVKPLPRSTDFRRANKEPSEAPPQHSLAVGTVRFAGEAVAAVVAETYMQARDALEAITVDYSPLPVVADMAAAVAAGSPLVWDAATGNIAAEMRHGDTEATNKAFRVGGACGQRRSRQPARDPEPDRAARDAGVVRPRQPDARR
jgi:carbon-monoxide dehydrogenase large subunit